MDAMKAAVIYGPGGPDVLKIESRPIPKPQAGEVLIQVKAFGLNRSELFTRQGLSPGVLFPRVLGIEAVGLVQEAPGGEFTKDEIVATAMGGMGRQFDGGYAEYTCVPASQVQVIKTSLAWETLGALPATDGLGLAVQVAASRQRRAPADPRWHDVRWIGRSGNWQKSWGNRCIDDPQV